MIQTIMSTSAFISCNFSEYRLMDKASAIKSRALRAASSVFCSISSEERLVHSAAFCRKKVPNDHQNTAENSVHMNKQQTENEGDYKDVMENYTSTIHDDVERYLPIQKLECRISHFCISFNSHLMPIEHRYTPQ